MKKRNVYLVLTISLIFMSLNSIAQGDFDLEKMRAKYEARKPQLDTMYNYPTDFGMEYESFICQTEDSIEISGWFIPNETSSKTILMVHGFDMNKSLMLSRAELFFQEGYSVLLIDLRARGESGGDKATRGKLNGLDISASYNWYQENHVDDYGAIVFYGYSHGGRAIIFGAHKIGGNEQIILESTPYILAMGFERQYNFPSPMPITEAEMDLALSELKSQNVLLLIGDDDTAIIPAEANNLLSKLNQNSESRLVIFEETQHSVFCDKNRTQFQEVIQSFLK